MIENIVNWIDDLFWKRTIITKTIVYEKSIPFVPHHQGFRLTKNQFSDPPSETEEI